jgi:hypothetical protein
MGYLRGVHQALTVLRVGASAEMLLASENAIVRLDPAQIDLPKIRTTVANAGHRVPEQVLVEETALAGAARAGFTRGVLRRLGSFSALFSSS